MGGRPVYEIPFCHDYYFQFKVGVGILIQLSIILAILPVPALSDSDVAATERWSKEELASTWPVF